MLIFMVKKATQRLYILKQLKRAGLPSNHLFIFTAQLYVQFFSTVFLCGTMLSLTHKLNSLKLFRREPSTLFWISPVPCRTCLCYLQLISLHWPLVERISPGNSLLKSHNPLLVWSTSPWSKRSLSFLDLAKNFPECLLGQNDIVPLYSMH